MPYEEIKLFILFMLYLYLACRLTFFMHLDLDADYGIPNLSLKKAFVVGLLWGPTLLLFLLFVSLLIIYALIKIKAGG